MFRFNENLSYRMPAHFGAEPGRGFNNTQYDDITFLAISYRTDKDELSQYVPEAFEILEPVVQVGYQKCCGVQWMWGASYTLISLMTPAQHISSETVGSFVLVMWENKVAPILRGREETGIPKIFADIPDYHRLGDCITASASHEDRVFLELELNMGETFTAAEMSAMNRTNRINQLGWRYIPNVGRPGAALSHATLFPVDTTFLAGNRGTGKVAWTQANPRFNPQQAGIINALADLPILEYGPCFFAKTTANLRGDLAREL